MYGVQTRLEVIFEIASSQHTSFVPSGGKRCVSFVLSRAEIGPFDSVLLASCPTLHIGSNIG